MFSTFPHCKEKELVQNHMPGERKPNQRKHEHVGVELGCLWHLRATSKKIAKNTPKSHQKSSKMEAKIVNVGPCWGIKRCLKRCLKTKAIKRDVINL